MFVDQESNLRLISKCETVLDTVNKHVHGYDCSKVLIYNIHCCRYRIIFDLSSYTPQHGVGEYVSVVAVAVKNT